jgi:hypothetical protein
MKAALRTKVLIGAALAITGYVVFGPGDAQTVEVAKSADRASGPRATHSQQTHTLRRDPAQILYFLTHRVADGGASQSLFAPHTWYTPPPPPPPPPAPALTAAQEAALRAPVAPPLPYAFMGSYVAAGGNPVFFLTQGNRVYNVKVGDTLDDTYSVDSVTNGQLVMTYKPLKIQQQLTVGSIQ